MPVKKDKKPKKKIIKQKQKQKQTQNVIVNIHKPTRAKPEKKGSAKITSVPMFQAQSFPYPSYSRQVTPTPVNIPVASSSQPVGKTIGETPRSNIPFATVAEPVFFATSEPAKTETIDDLKRADMEHYEKLLKKKEQKDIKEKAKRVYAESRKINETEEAEPYQFSESESPMKNVRFEKVYAPDTSQYFNTENPLKQTRRYTKRKVGPRRNSLEDLNNRFREVTGEDYNGPSMKVGAFKEYVERLEASKSFNPYDEDTLDN
jgi:hypothetical protein